YEDFRVVGIVGFQGGFGLAGSSSGILAPIFFSPAYSRAHPDTGDVLAARLRRGAADVPAFTHTLDRLAGGSPAVTLTGAELTPLVQRSVDVQAATLRLLAVAVGVVAVLLLGQALTRQAWLEADDHPLLGALGMTP